jgi:FAD/FMN-containing dehydrogenase
MMSLLSRLHGKMPRLGYWSSIPAAVIDKLYLNEKSGFFQQSWHFLKIRAVYLFMFLPLAAIDLFTSGILALRYAVATLFLSDSVQDKKLALQKRYASQFSKLLYSLLSFAFGLVSPKLLVFFFTPEQTKQEGVQAGGHYYQDKDALLVSPKSVEQLQEVLVVAHRDGKKVMPIGAGLSQGKQFLPAGGSGSIVVDLSEFNTIDINTDEKTVTVGAGTIWEELQNAINHSKLALKVMQASNVFSVGGSVGTNIHGWDHRSGSIVNTILSLEVVNAQGEKQVLTPSDDLFHQVIGGLGLFGIVTKVKFQLTDNVLLKEKGTDVSIDEYTRYFRQTVQTSDQTKMHLYRLSLDPSNLLGTGVAVSYDHDGSSPIKAGNLTQEDNQGSRFNRVMINLARRFDWVRAYYWKGERARLLANNSPALSTNEVMQPPIKAMFNPSVSEAEWLQEFFIPEERLTAFLNELGALLMANEVCLLNASVRFVKQHHQSHLSYAATGDRFAVVLCFNQSFNEEEIIKAKKWLRKAQHLAVEKGGAYYLPYQHVSSPEDFNKAYPKADRALQYKQQVDPKNLFSSGLSQKYLAPVSEMSNYFKIIMRDSATKKEFAGFLENVLQRIDTEQFFSLLTDVMEYNDSHEEIYKELSRRLPEVMPGAIGSLKRILNSLSAIKTDLGAQAHTLLPSDLTEINGLVEIGYPGRFVNGFKQHYKVTGSITAVYEQQSVTDYIQAGFPRPYDHFAKLDYKKPNLKGLVDKSADVITCYVGLHHFPQEELDLFLSDVRRVLRDGGHFILVDHDITNEKTLAMAHMAHMVFNAVTGVSVEEEMAELRNFQPMSYWQKCLQKHDLSCDIEGAEVPMIRSGDPSRNRMMSFAKTGPAVSSALSVLKPSENREDVALSATESHTKIFAIGGGPQLEEQQNLAVYRARA